MHKGILTVGPLVTFGLGLAAAACTEDYNCADTATCVVAKQQLTPDAAPATSDREPLDTTLSTSGGAHSTLADDGSSQASAAPGDTSATPSLESTEAATSKGEPSGEDGGPLASGGAALGETCAADSVCESGHCEPVLGGDDGTQRVCCSAECGLDEGCRASGECGECATGEQATCWETEAGDALPGSSDELRGNCILGIRTCETAGRWGACVGAVGPKSADECLVAGSDDDCDGLANEGCACTEGEERDCGTNTGNCVTGVQKCQGGTWSGCEGQVVASGQDSCLDPGDDANCNGAANEGCTCVGTAQQACGDCGVQLCAPDTRTWGPCGPSATPAQSQCRNGSTTLLETCDSQGKWTTTSCDFVCVDGECGGECSPGRTQCLHTPERRQSCSGGTWDTVESCPTGSVCVGGGTECRRIDGSTCSNDNQCVSGACVDGTCCATDCAPVSCATFDTQCRSHPATVSRNLCGSDGQCESPAAACMAASKPAPDTAACEYPSLAGGQCDGFGECKPPAVICGNQTCSLDTELCCAGVDETFECATPTTCLNRSNETTLPVAERDREITCDEHADCGPGRECGVASGSSYTSTMCFDADECPFPAGASASCRDLCASPATGVLACAAGLSCEETYLPGWYHCVADD